MGNLITLTKVGIFDEFGGRISVDSESIRVQIDGVSSIETDTSGAIVLFKQKQVLDGKFITGLVVSQTPAQIQTAFDASGTTVNPVSAISSNGAVTIPSVNTTFYFTKAGVASMTIADPTSTTHDGLRLTFVATTAQANTITNTTGFNDGGTSSDVATFGGAKGDNIVIEAYQGKWYVVSKVNVTLA